MAALPGLSFLCLPALYHVYVFMFGIPVCNRLVYHLETQRRIEKRRKEKRIYKKKPCGFVLLGTVFSFCLPFLFSSSYDVLLLSLIKLWAPWFAHTGEKIN